ncbi:MAG TPA: hypothetical protein VHH36_02375, partial [Candidatus Thermoplasmatota archaeon]|nr:hypothetical protein [Candidatus Thermoplasmatota archaeon]
GVVLARLVVDLPALSALFVVGSAASFVGGAVVDGAGRPAPRAIGAHGLFHLLVLGGCALAFAAVALHAT